MLRFVLATQAALASLPGPTDRNRLDIVESAEPALIPSRYYAEASVRAGGIKDLSATDAFDLKVTVAVTENQILVNYNNGDSVYYEDIKTRKSYQAMKAMDKDVCIESNGIQMPISIFPGSLAGFYANKDIQAVEIDGTIKEAIVFETHTSLGSTRDQHQALYVDKYTRQPLKLTTYIKTKTGSVPTFDIIYHRIEYNPAVIEHMAHMPEKTVRECFGPDVIKTEQPAPTHEAEELIRKSMDSMVNATNEPYFNSEYLKSKFVAAKTDEERMVLFKQYREFYGYTADQENDTERFERFVLNMNDLVKKDFEGHAKFHVNGHMDRHQQEIYSMRPMGFSGVPTLNMTEQLDLPINVASTRPSAMDWREKAPHMYHEVYNQALCGSCWTFSFMGAVEAANYLKTGKYVKLPQQFALDCTWDLDARKKSEGTNSGCDGGMMENAADRIMKLYGGGVPSAEVYGEYRGMDHQCLWGGNMRPATMIKGWNTVPFRNSEALMDALANNGPVSIAVNMSPMMTYSHGIVQTDACYNTQPDQLNHAVLLVGYGTAFENGESVDYWSIKNEWGPYWGMEGYFYVERGLRDCGISIVPGYPVVESPDAEVIV